MTSCRFAPAKILWSPALLFLALIRSWMVPARGELGVLMPMYSETSAIFNAAYAALGRVPLIVAINPNDGPGSSRDNALRTFCNNIKTGGGQIIGYVNALYGELPLDDAELQMNAYINFYAVDGFFIDEVPDARPSFNNSLRSRASGRFIVLNPGTNIPTSNNAAARIIVTYENPLGGDQSAPFLSYSSNLTTSSTQSAAVIYSTGSASIMRACVDRALIQGYDWIYVTNDDNPNPFDGVPSYWTEEINYIAGKNLPPPVPAELFRISLPVAAAGGGWILSFPTASGRTYEVQTSTNLQTWSTATLTIETTAARKIATTTELIMTVNPPPNTSTAFFRGADVTP